MSGSLLSAPGFVWDWLAPMPTAVRIYVLAMALVGVWVLWRIFGPNGSAW